MRSIVAVALLALCAVASVSAQAPIPYRPDGYQIGGPVDAPIVMDAFVDLLCPDCAAAWPNILDVADHYGSNISMVLHTFPLPYHTNGFLMAQAAHVAIDAQPKDTGLARSFANWAFKNQAQWWNPPTADKTFNSVQADIGKQAVAAGLVSQADFDAGMASDYLNNEVRVSWKYACSRGVLGTPTFLVNGVFVDGDPTWTLADWRQVLDPLLQPQPSSLPALKPRHRPSKPHPAATGAKCKKSGPRSTPQTAGGMLFCPVGEPLCQYSPGKTECCLPGENCIPNVGCRC